MAGPVSVFDEISADTERRLVAFCDREAEMEPGKCPHHLAGEDWLDRLVREWLR